jgi:dTDP-4-dehydrorhamnose 3,5-epimerase
VIFTELELEGAFVIGLEPIEDERGFFALVWAPGEFAQRGLETRIAQCNLAYNERAGTLRGLHFQTAPHAEVKLIRCTRGAVYDVIVDLRPESPTYMRWQAVELTAENGQMLYVPEGFAHGYQTLVDATETYYQVSHPYVPAAQAGVRWDDPAFGIEWPDADERIISARDRAWNDYVPVARPTV